MRRIRTDDYQLRTDPASSVECQENLQGLTLRNPTVDLSKADVYVLSFDVEFRDSLSAPEQIWVPDIQNLFPKVPLILVGTNREIRMNGISLTAQIENMKRIRKARADLECSAKDMINAKGVFAMEIRAGFHPTENVIRLD
jgi:hypothetical protein